MLTVHISFNGDANRGSFAIDAIAETICGDWSSKSSTNDSGTITNVDNDNRQWVEELLSSDEQVESFSIIEE